MTTGSHAVPSRPLSSPVPARASVKGTAGHLVEAFARWALGATVLLSGLLGLENDIGLGRPASFLVMAFLGFAFTLTVLKRVRYTSTR